MIGFRRWSCDVLMTRIVGEKVPALIQLDTASETILGHLDFGLDRSC
jgi:hypothetical protein